MMKIEFTTNGAAFCNDFTGEPDIMFKLLESERILRKITTEMEHGHIYGSIIDTYGNKVGEWSLDD